MTPLSITAAICGAEITRKESPYLPITAEELAEEAWKCQEAGASIIHLHVRDDQGDPTQDIEVFRRAVAAMKARGVTAVIQPSTGGAVGMTAEERMQPVFLNPEMASLDCGTLNFGESYFVNDFPMMRTFAAEMKARQVMPELECFEGGHIANALKLRDEGLLPEHLHFNLVLGVPGAMAASVKNLLFMTELLPPGATWTVSAVGRHQLPLDMATLALGGHIRVGMEDNIYLSRGVLSEGNAPFVRRIAGYAADLGRPVATPGEVRQILSLRQESL